MATTVHNSGGLPFLILKGNFVVRSRQMPDGDTVAFAASAKYKAGKIVCHVPVDTTGQTSANVRLQSSDAPEKTQPWGAASRDALLRRLGYDPASLGLSDADFSANTDPVLKPGWLATNGIDNPQFGRALGYIFRSRPGKFKHGDIVSAADMVGVLKASENYRQVSAGWSFPAFYNNTDEAHAVVFAAAAVKARKALRHVWADDKSISGFVPTKDALHIGGTLIYPKFYRRVQKWKNDKPNAKAFINWLKTQDDGKKIVYGAQRDGVPLWKLFQVVSAKKVAVPYDVTKLWFSE